MRTATIYPSALGGAHLPEPTPPLVAHYEREWPGYVASIHAAEAAVTRLRATEREIDPGVYTSAWAWAPEGRHASNAHLRAAFSAIADYARRALCAGDACVLSDYEADRILEACGASKSPERPGFEVFWRALVSKYGDGEGDRRALRNCARAIRRALALYPEGHPDATSYRRERPVIEKGGVRFEFHYSWLSPSGKRYEMDYSHASTATEFVTSLGRLLPGEFEVAGHLALFADMRRGVDAIPLRVSVAPCRWTFMRHTTRLWMPADLALNLRVALDERDPPTQEAQ